MEGTLLLEQSDTKNYYIYYTLETLGDKYVSRGYYSTDGMTADTKNATLTQFYNGVDYEIDIIKGNSIQEIKGRISLPAGEKAPKGGMELTVNAITDNNSPEYRDDSTYATKFRIPEGKNYVNYTLEVMYAPYGYTVSYSISGNTLGYLSFGYYSDKGTQTNIELLTKVYASDYSKVNFILGKGYVIEGTLSLPVGDKAPVGGIYAEIEAMSHNDTYTDASDDFESSIHVIIPEGQNSVNYSMVVKESKSGYSIYYLLDEKQSNDILGKYMMKGFGTSTGYKYKEMKSNISNINLIITMAKALKGTIALPKGENAPMFGTDISIEVRTIKDNPDKLYSDMIYYAQINIPEVKNSIEFSVQLPEAEIKYHVKYFIYSVNSGYTPNGYVGESEIVDTAEKAHIFDGVKNSVNISISKK